MNRAVLVVALLAGCEPFDFDFDLDFRGGTSGELGRATFGYSEGCDKGLLLPYCDLDRGYAVLRGGSAVIDVWADVPLTRLAVRSGDASVLEVANTASYPNENLHVRVVGNAVGSAPLELYDGDKLFDRVWVSVEDATRIELDPDQLVVGGTVQSFLATAYAADGRTLFGRGVIAFYADDRPTLEPTADDLANFVGTDLVVVTTPVAPGTAYVLAASLDALVTSTAIDIVDLSAVDHIELLSSGVSDAKAGILFAPFSADSRYVRGAHCMPGVDAAFAVTLELHPAGPVPKFFVGDHVAVSSVEHGDATVTCTIGAVTASTALTF